MISRNTLHKLANEGLQLDMLGQPLAKGDTVLVKGYGSAIPNQFATIKRISKKSISVDLEFGRWDYGQYSPRPDNHVGPWNSWPDRKYISGTKNMRRLGLECLKINPEQQAYAEAREQELFNEYPELFI